MNFPLWMYWQGPMPDWIAACIQTHRRHWEDVRILNKDSFLKVWAEGNELKAKFNKLCYSHQSDIVRAYMLAHHGGMWCDADCIIFRPMLPLFLKLRDHDFVCGPQYDGSICAAFTLSQPDGEVASAWYERQVEVLRRGNWNWLDFGSNALGHALKGKQHFRLDSNVFEPVWWSDPEAFFRQRDDEGHIQHVVPNSYAYMISNNTLQRVKDQELQHPKTFFSFLLRCSALNGTCAPIRVDGKLIK